jgi:GT2 family glycosyltransferase
MKEPSIFVSVLNWNNYPDTSRCIESIKELDYTNLDIVLVDNGSTDGSPEKLHKEFPKLTMISKNKNDGFSGGHNDSISYSLSQGADYILILNNDVVLPNGSLSSLVSEVELNPQIGIISPKVLNGDDVWFEYGWVNTLTGGSGTGPIIRHLNQLVTVNSEQKTINTDYVPLCCALIRRSVFEQVGDLPEEYFLYTEDVDFCNRAANQEFRIVTHKPATVQHNASSSSGGAHNPVTNYYIARNRWIFARRTDTVIMSLFVLSYSIWLTKRSVHSLLHSRIDGFFALYLGAKDGLLNKTGRGRYP